MKKISFKLLFLFVIFIPMMECFAQHQKSFGAVIRGDMSQKKLSLVFTAHEYAEGADTILSVLKRKSVKGAFFLTGDFLRNPDFEKIIARMVEDGHYVGAHSDKHLLYCSWEDRTQLLIGKTEFLKDLDDNYRELKRFGIGIELAPYFLPPYEWYNDSISHWSQKYGVKLINFTPGTRSHADYTEPEMPNYITSKAIMESVWEYEQNASFGMNGFILLSHIGVGDRRQDKFFHKIINLIEGLEERGYQIVHLGELLQMN
jgi:peptidoglycan/xylan/chitin deacetylase (PgdA/CDA1 family)